MSETIYVMKLNLLKKHAELNKEVSIDGLPNEAFKNEISAPFI